MSFTLIGREAIMSFLSRLNLVLILALSSALAFFALGELQHLPLEQLNTDHSNNLAILGYVSAAIAAISGVGVVVLS